MAKTGSAMSSKQLARTVMLGRRIALTLTNGEKIVGYLCGMDDFHWMVVTPDGEKALTHKGNVSVVRLGEESTYESEPKREELEKVVGPFRQFVAGFYFGQDDSAPATTERAS